MAEVPDGVEVKGPGALAAALVGVVSAVIAYRVDFSNGWALVGGGVWLLTTALLMLGTYASLRAMQLRFLKK